MIQFRRRFFPERNYRLRLRWIVWGAMAVTVFAVFLFMRSVAR